MAGRSALVALALACAFLAQAGQADAATVAVNPVVDAWVDAGAPAANHGTDTTLQLGGLGSATEKRSFMRFNGATAGIPAGAVVTRTTLRIYFDSAPPGPYEVRLTTNQAGAPGDPPWVESGITWANRPTTTGPVATAFSGNAGYNDISVPLLNPAQTITYVLTRPDADTSVHSKEGVNKPQLVVEYEMPATSTTSVCAAAGCFESTPWLTSMSWGILVADFNGDGRDDHLISRHSNILDRIELQQADGSFAPLTGQIFPGGDANGHLPPGDRHGCAAGNVNGDSRTDIYCMVGGDGGETAGKSNELWIQQQDGTFAANQATVWGVNDPTGRGRRPLLFNFDRIGTRDDLYFTNFPRGDGMTSENKLFLNNTADTGPFVEKVVTATGDTHGDKCVDEGSWDHDAFRDLVVCGSQLHLFHNDQDPVGGGRLTTDRDNLLGSPLNSPEDAELTDVNGDTWDDIVVITKAQLQIRINNRCVVCDRFAQVNFSAQLTDANSVSVGDLTGDGSPDVYVVEGSVNGATGPRNAPDKLFVGPNWTSVDIPQTDIGTGDDSAFINVLGRQTLIVTNGRDYSRGPVQLIGFKPTPVTPPPGPGPGPGPGPPPPPPPPLGANKLAKLPKAADVVQLPAKRSCAGRGSIRIRIKSAGDVKFASAAVLVNGKRVKSVKQNKLTAPIRLSSLPKRQLTIKVVVKTTDGRQVSRSRKFRACAKKRSR